MTAADASVHHFRSTRVRRAVAAAAVLVCACIALGFFAYSGQSAQRIIVADTVVGYGPRPFRLDARATRSDGRSAVRARIRFEGRSSAGSVSDDGIARCTGSGTILATVRAARATAQIVVLCRPLKWIRGLMPMVGRGTPSDAPLYVGGPARRLEVQAYDIAGVPVERFSAREAVRDSNIARLDHGFIYPVGQGRTTVDLDLDGMAETVPIEVDARVVADAVRLTAGETRDWSIGPGWYEVWLEDTHVDTASGALSLTVQNANCVHAKESTRRLYCVVSDSATIVVARQRNTQSRSVSLGTLRVLLLPTVQ